MNIQDVKQLLIGAGFPENSLMFALAQACFESGGVNFDSPVNTENNNLTGIIFANAEWQHNATQGISKPAGEQAGFYANFATLEAWATDFYRIVHAQFNMIGWNQEGRPIEATTVEDYVHRLKLNHYFEADEATYLAGVQRYLNEITA
jgi:hypothetical protein